MCMGCSWKVKTASLRCFRHGAGPVQPSPSCSQAVSALLVWSAPTLVAAQTREPWVNLGPPGSRLSRQLRAALLGSHSLSKPKIHVLAIQAPAHEPQGSWSYRALVNTYVTFLAGARVRQIEKLKSIIITANEREGGSSAEQLRGPLRQKHRAHGTA